MYYIFYSTNDVYSAEEVLNNCNDISFDIVPTPIREEIFCGVCIFSDEETSLVKQHLINFRFEIWDNNKCLTKKCIEE